MNRTIAIKILTEILAVSLSCIFFASCIQNFEDGMIIFTQVSEKVSDYKNFEGYSSEGIHRSRIVAYDPGKPGKSLKIISKGYYSAKSPKISYDGKSLLFTARYTENDPWQIFEMNLKNSKIRKLISSPENCIDPLYLPDTRLVFSKLNKVNQLEKGYSLYSSNNGSNIQSQITFNPYSYSGSCLLKDGRVLTIRRDILHDSGKVILMVLRPDGTKAELFYKGNNDFILHGPLHETADGKIVFIESAPDSQKEDIISINYNRPMHSRVNLTYHIRGSFCSVVPMESGRFLVSYLSPDSTRYALYEFDPEKKALDKMVYYSPEFDATEAVVIEKHERPRKLPSEVDMEVKTGLLFCQDINFTGTGTTESSNIFKKAAKIEILGLNSSLGVVDAEKDGSIYLKVMADTPFRIQAMDENGMILNKTCDWLYLRPNERRGCVGCHEDPEMVPENSLSLSVRKPPVSIPVHLNQVKEKNISLE